jgi:hypothetical protein
MKIEKPGVGRPLLGPANIPDSSHQYGSNVSFELLIENKKK